MINSLPSSIATEIARVERAVSGWPVPIAIDHVIRWVLQFDRDDYGLAIRILENIDVLAQRDVRAAFQVAQAKLERAAIEKALRSKKRTRFMQASAKHQKWCRNGIPLQISISDF
ncbi:hypothetical protein DMH27_27135 [Raoultella planticola]|nr:hypothetical protein [Raoultella planticola]